MSNKDQKASENHNYQLKYLFQNILFSLLLSPLLFLSFVLVYYYMTIGDQKFNNIVSSFSLVFTIFYVVFALLSLLYVPLFVKDLNLGILIILICLTIVLFFYTSSNYSVKSKEIHWYYVLYLLSQSLFSSYIIIECIRMFFRKAIGFVFKKGNDNETIRNNLSFLNKIFIGIITSVASLVTLALTIQKLFT
ncbi:hypothetical protein [Staphylococcus sp.]|uniref:hypothetical protein n=1 Tax=Staphylococcus sp. TaxID=29387 RepID=UPI000EEC7E63|nr:hypothetical protein [Staphylococcus sp.]HBY82669.1 hypothetical protein [Staphylococcus sp.]